MHTIRVAYYSPQIFGCNPKQRLKRKWRIRIPVYSSAVVLDIVLCVAIGDSNLIVVLASRRAQLFVVFFKFSLFRLYFSCVVGFAAKMVLSAIHYFDEELNNSAFLWVCMSVTLLKRIFLTLFLFFNYMSISFLSQYNNSYYLPETAPQRSDAYSKPSVI